MRKIVVLDGYTLNPGDLSWSSLEKLGELKVYDRTEKKDVIERIGNAEYIFTNKTLITKEILDACPNIKFIGVLATGYNVVDFEEAGKRNIPVCNIPTYGTAAVAQFVFALLLEICNGVGHHNEAVKAGKWSECPDFCFWDTPQIELDGKTMGIIGFGRIGQNTAKLANAFGMKVLAYDKNKIEGIENENLKYSELDELFRKSDVISLHCPLFPETEGIINKDNIEKMKNSVIIINTSRGPLIVEKDLKEGLEAGKVYAAAIDVVSKEPIEPDNILLNCEKAIITPHIAWAPKESRERLLNIAVENLDSFIKGKIKNAVNM
ncbi:D-2-hydroxyacid dehydrogenase [Sebaldella sp. S0638]|uniref:D-2-hydroxyacid dehydrogenase n=1 Tax=Sebaldella sp. S0638 TaxID=2957809 RepID=UPI0020A171B0|nr:D-2-hydroxyacid dehydrogenase [Sebaldella sp. S0638]MCP1225961.1 D-2-hydroxyacid dehydrogenase [Sebaldella sp. S0638]